MGVKTVDLEKTPASVDDLLALLHADDEILLTRGDTLLARLTGVEAAESSPVVSRIPGLHTGTTWVSDDFDAPLRIAP